jgi:hypothetical protein
LSGWFGHILVQCADDRLGDTDFKELFLEIYDLLRQFVLLGFAFCFFLRESFPLFRL